MEGRALPEAIYLVYTNMVPVPGRCRAGALSGTSSARFNLNFVGAGAGAGAGAVHCITMIMTDVRNYSISSE